MKIRLADPHDFDAIWPILRDVFRRGDTYAVDPKISKAGAKQLWMTAARATYLAEIGDEVVGSYYIKSNQAGGGAHVCNCGFVVGTAARGQGVAGQMCDHAQAQAVSLGYRAMQFNCVVASNTGAVRLWRDKGFAQIGTIPQGFCHPEQGFVDAYIFFKSLI